MGSSIHEKLARVRKPRVHIKYDVETEGGVEKKELPFVVGVMGDFSADSTESLKPLKERKFTTINRDNFNAVMKKNTPGLSLKVKDTLSGEEAEIAVNLKFESMRDFEPEKIVAQVPALKQLRDTRNKLRDLLSKSDRSEELEAILEKTLTDLGSLKSLAKELGIEK